MINSFQGMNTITSGLILQELEQQVTANNLAQPYLDSQGYLMNSLEQVNSVDNPSISFNGADGLLSIGTGSSVASITSLRSSFLDNQIQQESSVLGMAEMLATTSGGANSTQGTGVLNQINTIVNGTSNLNTSLAQFAQDWTALAANPLNTGLRATVVNDGVAFAQMANSQYDQLQNLQLSTNSQIQQTVGSINQILQQLSAINQQLNTTQGSNQNTLLDARDYALDRLSRLINMQATFGSNGTVSVWLNGVALVNSEGAATFQTDVTNVNNPELLSVTLQSPNGSPYGSEDKAGVLSGRDVTSLITGGNLGGELQANNVILESYKDQVDQIATSVMNVTNDLEESGYAANGTTTGTPFFFGTGAADISVNAALVNDPTHALLAASNVEGLNTDGEVASFLGNLPNILANNFVESALSTTGGAAINSAGLLNAQPFLATPSGGSFTINGNTITYNPATDSINSLLSQINTKVPGVYAVFNQNTQQFFMFSANPITVAEVGADNFITWGNIQNVLTSTIKINNGFAPTDPKIVFIGTNSALDSLLPGATFNTGPNAQAYRVTPSSQGTFTINGIQFNWNNTESLSQIRTMINTYNWAGAGLSQVSLNFSNASQTLSLNSSNPPTPIQIVDNSGNFTVFTGLDGNVPMGDLTSGLLGNVSSQLSAAQLSQSTASNSLNQLNTEQANIAAVGNPGSGSTPGTAGVPIATLEQQALQSLIQYNASLQVLDVIDQMYEDLVGIPGSTTSNGIFQQVAL